MHERLGGGRAGTTPPGARCLALALAVAALVGCSTGPRQGPSPVPTPSAPPVRIVALGDSDTTGEGDPAGRGWVGRFGTLVEVELDRRAVVDNRAVEGKSSEQLRADVEHDTVLRRALARADVILVGIGGADLGAGDDAFGAGRCAGRACYTELLRGFDRNVRAVAREIHRLAPGALLRAITLPNALPGAMDVVPSFLTPAVGRYQVETERASVCGAMRASGGRCVDVAREFNGPRLDADAYATGLMTKDPCCYPSAKGQQRIAELVVAAGLPAAP